MTFYDRARERRRFRERHPHRAAGRAREPALHLPARGSAGRGAKPGQTYQHQRSRSGVAAVVLPLGQRSGRRACRGGDRGARWARRPASSSRSRRMLADPRASALSTRFASQWLRLQDLDKIHPDALLYPQFDTRSPTRWQRETRAALRAHRPRRSQRARAADRRLHVRERAAGAALRHPERQRARLPARGADGREPPRPASGRAAS